MGMLDRYKKTGGFNQLLTLLETCGPQKQQKFLEIIRQENPRWADALVAKMITLDRVLTWTDIAIGEITGAMLEINVAAVVKTLSPENRNRLLGTLAHGKRRKVEDLIESSNPSPGETTVSINRLYETVRALTQKGILRLDKIDPLLFVDGDIEDRLTQGKDIVGVPSFVESHAPKATIDPHEEVKSALNAAPHLKVVTSLDNDAWADAGEAKDLRAAQAELNQLRKKVVELQKENATLKQELTTAQTKLEQIRKLS